MSAVLPEQPPDAWWWIFARPTGICSYCGASALWMTQDQHEYCPTHLFITTLKEECLWR